MVTDAAVRGLKMLAYTKELDFVRAFAPTGMNINISIFGMDGQNGEVHPDAMQGAGTGTRTQQHFQETEVIYEPSLDPYSASYDPVRAFRFQERGIESTDSHVSYGQVYGIYYARLLDAILEGNIPEELREAIEKYFYGL